MSKDYEGAEEEEVTGDKVIEAPEADEAQLLKELEFIKLTGRHRLRITRHTTYVPDEDSKGDPAIIFTFQVIDSDVEEENSVQVDYFAPVSGPRRKDFTRLQLACGMKPRIPSEIGEEFLEEFLEQEVTAILRPYKSKRGERKGQWRNSVQDFLYGSGEEKLDEFLKR